MRLEIRNILENIVNVALLIITLFLTGRIVFQLLNANPTTPFIAWIYNVSAYLMTPFRGIFSSVNITPSAVLDVPAIFSMIAYSVIGFIIFYLIRAFTSHTLHNEENSETHAHSH